VAVMLYRGSLSVLIDGLMCLRSCLCRGARRDETFENVVKSELR
jgi:hypothetical protein